MRNTIFSIAFEIPIKDFFSLKAIIMALITVFIMIFATIVHNEHNRNTVIEKFEQFKKK